MKLKKSLFCQWCFLPNRPKTSKVNVAEHHAEIVKCCLPNKGQCTVQIGGHRTESHKKYIKSIDEFLNGQMIRFLGY